MKKKYPRGPQFNVRISPLQMAELKYKASSTGQSISRMVRRLMETQKLISVDGRK